MLGSEIVVMRQLKVICEGEKEMTNKMVNFWDTNRIISELLGKRIRLPAIIQYGRSVYHCMYVKSNKHPKDLEPFGTLRF